jgi:hypothetical protein
MGWAFLSYFKSSFPAPAPNLGGDAVPQKPPLTPEMSDFSPQIAPKRTPIAIYEYTR